MSHRVPLSPQSLKVLNNETEGDADEREAPENNSNNFLREVELHFTKEIPIIGPNRCQRYMV
jgi:hypothetical protein